MTIEQKIANLFQMTDEVWARHANPWSVLTRFPILPLIIVSIWSRIWINWWCLIPIYVEIFRNNFNWLIPKNSVVGASCPRTVGEATALRPDVIVLNKSELIDILPTLPMQEQHRILQSGKP